jgi:hypothetical protein
MMDYVVEVELPRVKKKDVIHVLAGRVHPKLNCFQRTSHVKTLN